MKKSKEVFLPITMTHAVGKVQEIEYAYGQAVKLIKEKLLDSYRNGAGNKASNSKKYEH